MFFWSSFSDPFKKGLELILEPLWGKVGLEKNPKNGERVIKFEGYRFPVRDSISEIVGGRFEPVLGLKMEPKWAKERSQKYSEI